jgi:hypothetical protein
MSFETVDLELIPTNGFYEIYVDGEPTGMGSTDYEQAKAMMEDYGETYLG